MTGLVGRIFQHLRKKQLPGTKAPLNTRDVENELTLLNDLIHYPVQAKQTPMISVEALLWQHSARIRAIKRNIGLSSDESKEFNSVVLVDDVLRNFIRYCHLLPASEMDHHHHLGGLLEHSLDVSDRALQFAVGSMLDEIGIIDEDVKRRPRYEYAAWLCGLLHDAGKIISNVVVIAPNTGNIWQPISEDLYQWADKQKSTKYVVSHKKDRVHNEHETNSIHFLSLVLNDTARRYLLGGIDDLFALMTQTLVGYSNNQGYLYNAVRRADSASTYEDYARAWNMGAARQKSTVSAIVDAMRSLYSGWRVNQPGGEIFVFKGQVFITSQAIEQVIKKCRLFQIPVPTTPKALINILIEKRILSMVSDANTYGMLYLGEFTKSDIDEFVNGGTGPLNRVPPTPALPVEWANFVIADNPLPDSAYGVMRFSTKDNKNQFVLANKYGVTTIKPAPTTPVTSSDTTTEPVISDTNPVTEPVAQQQAPVDIEPTMPAAQPTPELVAQPEGATPAKATKTAKKPAAKKTNTSSVIQEQPPVINEPQTTAKTASKNGAKPETAKAPVIDSSKPYPWKIGRRKKLHVDDALKALLADKEAVLTAIGWDNSKLYIKLFALVKYANIPRMEVVDEMVSANYIEQLPNGKYFVMLTKGDASSAALFPTGVLATYLQGEFPANKLSAKSAVPQQQAVDVEAQQPETPNVTPAPDPKTEPTQKPVEAPTEEDSKPVTATSKPKKPRAKRTPAAEKLASEEALPEVKVSAEKPKPVAPPKKAKQPVATKVKQPAAVAVSDDELRGIAIQEIDYMTLAKDLASEAEVSLPTIKRALREMKIKTVVDNERPPYVLITENQLTELKWKLNDGQK